MSVSQNTMLKIRQFGQFEVIQDGEFLSADRWPQRKTKALLKVLVSERGRTFTQDQLVDLLFPELDVDKAAKSLYNRISELRHLLEPDLSRGNHSTFVLRVGKGSYAFNKDINCWIDTEIFKTHLETARDFEQSGHWAEAVHEFRQAVDLYQGEYLSEDRYEEWALEARQHWRNIYHQALLEMAVCHAHLQRYELAIDCCQQVIDDEPVYEKAYQQQMRYAAKMGNETKALHIYQSCVTALNTLLEVNPSSNTQEIYQQILQQQKPQPPKPDPIKTENSTALEVPTDYIPEKPKRRSGFRPGKLQVVTTVAIVITIMLSVAGWWTMNSLSASVEIPSVAVLPFVSIDTNDAFSYWFTTEDFANSLTVELTNVLSQVEGLRVAASTSTFALQNSNLPISTISEILGVGTLLEGSIRKSGNQLRVTFQLINAVDGLHIWSGKYDTQVNPNSFSILDEIIPDIVNDLSIALGVQSNVN